MNNELLSNYSNDKNNNLDIIRFTAAILVMFSHSYPLTLGSNNLEPFYIFTHGQATLGHLAVSIFFIVSGFLITKSFIHNPKIYNYMKSRILRIFPGLLFALIITAFIIGPLMTELPISEYFSNALVYKYFVAFLLIPSISPNLPGVFLNNPYGTSVNGSLWTLIFEFLFYIVIAVLGKLKILNKHFIIIIFAISLTLSLVTSNILLHNLFTLSSFFFSGSLLFLFRDIVKLKNEYALISIILLICGSKLYLFDISMALFGAYLIIFLAFQNKVCFNNFSKYGDFSYGLYIYAFPIQQAMISKFVKQSPLTNFIFSLPLTFALAFLSWHLIEKRVLRLKHISYSKFKLDTEFFS